MAFYEIQVGYQETNYVERSVLVKAESVDEARQKVMAGEVLDEKPEDACEPLKRDNYTEIKAPILIQDNRRTGTLIWVKNWGGYNV